VWSGSAVVDTADTAGFGAGAVIALATQPDAQAGGAQAQFLWYSTDGGRTFSSYSDRPVLPNPGIADFRDPKVIWEAGRWVALVSEGSKISFYTSANLRDWSYASGFVRDGLGLLECQDLFRIQAADDTATWVLGVSANGKPAGLPNTYAYWTGDFDGTEFRPHAADPQWLDHGFDWYAGVTWEKYNGGQLDPTTRYALAWLNNWDYAHNTPTLAADGFNGTDSIVREISLQRWASGELGLISRPVAALDQHVTRTTSLGDIAVDGLVDLSFQGVAYEISAEIRWDQLQGAGMQLRKAGDRYVDAGVFDGYAYVNRGATGNPDTSGRWLESHSPFDMAARQARLRVLIDRTSVELFVDDGRYTHSQLVFPEPGDAGIALFTQGGSAVFGNVMIREFGQIT
jgi:levanbiose-producing levanase